MAMLMKKALLVVLCISLTIINNAESATPTLSPSPAVDCSNLILNMADCLSYVSNGSTVSKPEGTCCSGLKTVLKANAECLCEAFKSSAQLGVVLNVTKAVTLPSACHVSAPSVSNCGLSTVTGAAPVLSPAFSPMSTAAAPGTSAANEQAPALAPAVSSSAFLSISVASVVVGLALASSFSF